MKCARVIYAHFINPPKCVSCRHAGHKSLLIKGGLYGQMDNEDVQILLQL